MDTVSFTIADIEEVIDWGMATHFSGRLINTELLDRFIALKNKMIEHNLKGLP